MKKLIVFTAASIVVFALLRRFGPAVRDRAMVKCQEMMGRMSEIAADRAAIAPEEIRRQTSGMAG